jgi:hypothetical protein
MSCDWWFLEQGISKIKWKLDEACVSTLNIPVSRRAGSEIINYGYPDGKIRAYVAAVICIYRYCNRFEWSFTHFGSAN